MSTASVSVASKPKKGAVSISGGTQARAAVSASADPEPQCQPPALPSAAPVEPPDFANDWEFALHQFVVEQLERSDMFHVTVEEVVERFVDDLARRPLSPVSKTTILRAMPAFIFAVHGIVKSHSLKRSGKNVRGFRGLCCIHTEIRRAGSALPEASYPVPAALKRPKLLPNDARLGRLRGRE